MISQTTLYTFYCDQEHCLNADSQAAHKLFSGDVPTLPYEHVNGWRTLERDSKIIQLCPSHKDSQ